MVLRPYRHPQADRQYGRSTPPRRGPGTLCYHQGGRGVGGQPREMPSAFEGRCSTGGAVALQRGGRNTIEELDLTPELIARARAGRGDAPLSQPRRKRNRRIDRSAESGKRRRAEHCHRTHRNTSPPFPQLGKRRPPGTGRAAGRSANCGNNLFAHYVRLRSEIDP